MKLLFDVFLNEWHQQVEDEPSVGEVSFTFLNNGELPVVFEDLHFGYSVSSGETEFQSGEFPAEGVTYIRTDQEEIESVTLNETEPDTEYVVNVWARNAGVLWEGSFPFFVDPLPLDSEAQSDDELEAALLDEFNGN